MNKVIFAGEHNKNLDLSVLNDQRPPACPGCGRRMVWGGATHGWSCLVCVFARQTAGGDC
jgi:tRNA(Ile2) C34 agmatinyltransferase TiaS